MYTALYIAHFVELAGVQAMKRTEIKRRPLSDTVLANLEPNQKNIGSWTAKAYISV